MKKRERGRGKKKTSINSYPRLNYLIVEREISEFIGNVRDFYTSNNLGNVPWNNIYLNVNLKLEVCISN